MLEIWYNKEEAEKSTSGTLTFPLELELTQDYKGLTLQQVADEIAERIGLKKGKLSILALKFTYDKRR